MRRFRSRSINIRRVVFGVAVVCVFGAAANGAPWDGNGTPNEPYLIYDANDMQAIGADSNYWDAHFKLMADIDLSAYTGASFNIIGEWIFYDDPNNEFFTGVFDGNGHTISNFQYNCNDINGIGLFRCIGYISEINNLIVEDVNVNAGNGTSIGGVVGVSYGTILNSSASGVAGGRGGIGLLVGDNRGIISNCNSAGIVFGETYLGGLAGINNQGQISNCSSVCDITGNEYIGGLIGINYYSSVSDSYAICTVSAEDGVSGLVGANVYSTTSRCFSNGTVTGTNFYAGGLVGFNNNSQLTDCYSIATVDGNYFTGGLIGMDAVGTISNCYSAGYVSGDIISATGALIGFIQSSSTSSFTSCFWDSDVNPTLTGVGAYDPDPTGIIGKSTIDMKTESTFTDAGWDFVGETANGIDDIWRMCIDEVSYPRLSWRFNTADFDCPDGVEYNDLAILCEQWLLEELSSDVWPDGGDGIVNFLDWAVFANQWQIMVNYEVLADFADQWLKTGANYYIADIAPAPSGDGIVNMLDFAALANDWLVGVE